MDLFEPEEAQRIRDEWREKILTSQSWVPIFQIVKTTQSVFNGYGAQETSDMLFAARIHPRMPCYLVCKDDELWKSFNHQAATYSQELIRRLQPAKSVAIEIVPQRQSARLRSAAPPSQKPQTRAVIQKEKDHTWHYVSGASPFRMNIDGHNRFLSGVTTYRRLEVNLEKELFQRLSNDGLLNPRAVIQDDGTAKGAYSCFSLEGTLTGLFSD